MLNAEAWTFLDATAIDALSQLHDELEQRGITLCFARLKGRQREIFAETGLTDADRARPLLPDRARRGRGVRTDVRLGADPVKLADDPP